MFTATPKEAFSMKKYRGAIFDVDGTLLDTIADIGNSANLVLQKYHCPTHPIEAYKKFVGQGLFNTLRRAFPAGTPEEQLHEIHQCMLEIYADHYMDDTQPYPGMAELVTRMHESGILLGVNSNKTHLYTANLIKALFPHIPFVDVIGEGEAYPRKPDPAAALHIAEQMALDPSEILYIGDTGTDVDTAKNAGMDSVGCIWGFHGEEELRKHGATYLIHEVEEIAQFFELH